jgi:phage-related protein
MSTFPVLKTGAVLQYPATRVIQNSTCVLQFLDGAEQRFPQYQSPLRKWTVRLDLLDESEMASLEEFFLSEQGQSGSFSFIDPWDGISYPNCSLEGDAIPLEFQDLMRGRTTLVVKENRD